jgi:hypothetical protein
MGLEFYTLQRWAVSDSKKAREQRPTVVSSVIFNTSFPSADFHFTTYRAWETDEEGSRDQKTRTDVVWGPCVEGLCSILELGPGVDVDHRIPAFRPTPPTANVTPSVTDPVTPDKSGRRKFMARIKTGILPSVVLSSYQPWRQNTSPSVCCL